MSIPLTILGGFLGAGKTTALNRLLREPTGRVGVLVNDFGAINVDAALIAAAGGDVMQLANGCVCCAVGPDLSDSLARMVALAPDRIVVEASGVADPWRLAQVARLQPGIVLDAVLVLADATEFPTHAADPWLADTLARQVQRADLVALSKCDAASPLSRAATAAALHRMRPAVRVIELADGMLPGLLMLGAAPASLLAADNPGTASGAGTGRTRRRWMAPHCARCWRAFPPPSCGRRVCALSAQVRTRICCNWPAHAGR